MKLVWSYARGEINQYYEFDERMASGAFRSYRIVKSDNYVRKLPVYLIETSRGMDWFDSGWRLSTLREARLQAQTMEDDLCNAKQEQQLRKMQNDTI